MIFQVISKIKPTKCSHSHNYFRRQLLKTRSTTQPPPITREEYRPVPHYHQMSALYIRPPDPSTSSSRKPGNIFPKIVTPELNLSGLFLTSDMDKSSLNLNLLARQVHLNLEKLRKDYLKMRSLEIEIERLEAEKNAFSERINNLIKQGGGVKNRKALLESKEAKEWIKAGNEIKARVNKILEEFLPFAEIVNVACLRLPNSLHFSTLLLDSISPNSLNEDRFKHVLFEMNSQYLDPIKQNIKNLDHGLDWKNLLDDNVLIDFKQVVPKYAQQIKMTEKWSYVKESSVDSIQNNRYLVGTYARLEQSIVDYVHFKLNNLNDSSQDDIIGHNFEHVKGVSMFKSAVIEGCGDNFTNTKHIFNIVRFGGSGLSQDGNMSDRVPADIELWHLIGASSLNSLVLGFIRTEIKEKYLPWTVFTNGKFYSPDSGQTNSFDLLTLTSDGSKYIMDNYKSINDINLILTNGRDYLDEIKTQLEEYVKNCDSLSANDIRKHLIHTNKKLDQIFIDYLKLFVYVYKDFNLPMRFLCLNANQLKSSESFLIEVQAYLPSAQNYVTIGEVSLLNDYVSSRLQIRCSQTKGKCGDIPNKDNMDKTEDFDDIKHANMIYCRLIDINVFIQILSESNIIKTSKISLNQTSGNGNVSFVLPNLLKDFFIS